MPERVELRVYDLSMGMARQVSGALLGRQIDAIYHTGIHVFGREFFFGGGIQSMTPREVELRYGMSTIQVIELGHTEIEREAFEAYLKEIGPRFTMYTYDLLRHNCNNFSNEVAEFLVGTSIPRHIIDLPNEALSSPLGAMLRPFIENIQNSMRSNMSQGDHPAFGIPFNAPRPAPSRALAPAQLPPQQVERSVLLQDTVDGEGILQKYNRPLLSTDASIVPALRKKIKSLVELSDEEEERLRHVETVLMSDSASTSPYEPWGVLWKIYSMLPKDQKFPILCILRIAVLDRGVNEYYAKTYASQFELIATDLARRKISGRSNVLMALCLLANSFAHEHLSNVIISSEEESSGAGIAHFRDDDLQVRLMASAMMYNFVLKAAGTIDTEDRVVVLSGLLEQLSTEADSQVIIRRIVSIGRLFCYDVQEALKMLDAEVELKQIQMTRSGEESQLAQYVLQLLK